MDYRLITDDKYSESIRFEHESKQRNSKKSNSNDNYTFFEIYTPPLEYDESEKYIKTDKCCVIL